MVIIGSGVSDSLVEQAKLVEVDTSAIAKDIRKMEDSV
jgi:hypothetical protein